MIKKIMVLFLFFIFLSTAAASIKAGKSLAYFSEVNLQVINVDKCQKQIIEYLKTKRGYFTNRHHTFMQIKIKPNNLLSFIDFLKDKGIIVSQEISSINYRDKLHNLQITIKTQSDSLIKIMRLFNIAGLDETMDIESRIQDMIKEIETAKGRLRYILEHIKYAYVNIRFKTFSKGIRRQVRSPFKWINELRLEKLFRGM